MADIFYKLEDLEYYHTKVLAKSIVKADIHYHIPDHISFMNISAYNNILRCQLKNVWVDIVFWNSSGGYDSNKIWRPLI